MRRTVHEPVPEFGNAADWVVITVCVDEDIGVEEIEQMTTPTTPWLDAVVDPLAWA